MDLLQAKSFLNGTNSTIGDLPQTPLPSLTPKTDEALIFSDTPAMRAQSQTTIGTMPTIPPGVSQTLQQSATQQEKDYQQKNAIGGVPLDTEEGVSTWERLNLSFRREQQNQIKYLESKYGAGTVRIGTDGALIVRMPDPETGKTKDVVADEQRMTGKDFIDMMGQIPEIAMSMIATRGARALPLVGKLKSVRGVLRDIIAATAGGEVTGGAKDVAMNVYDRGQLDLENVAKARSEMAAVDVGVAALSIPAAKFFQWLKNPAAGYRRQVQFDAISAQKYFKEKYGVEVPLSIGESTGMPLASRSEVFIEKMPGGSDPIRTLKRTQEEQLRKLQTIMMGSDTPTDQEMGEKAIAAIRAKIEPVTTAVDTAKGAVAKEATSGIESIISGVSQPERELYKSTLGGDIRTKVIAQRDAAKAEADKLYDAVRTMPGGEGKSFDGTRLQKAFSKIRDSLPAPQQQVETPSFLVDAQGAPIRTSESTVKTMREFVPPNVLSRLESVIGLKDAKFGLSDLQQMRREVYDDIAKGEGVPGLGTHYLNDMGKALTEAIEKGVEDLPDGQLKVALQAANQHYKDNVLPFNRQGLTELFRRADEPGFISDSEIVGRLLGGDKALHNWQMMKETLGDSSPEFTRMKRAVLDNIIERSRLPGDEMIDAKSLRTNLNALRLNQREITDDIFGKNQQAMHDLFMESRRLGYAQGDKLNADALQKLVQSGNVTSDKLKVLVDAERATDEAYKNQLVKAVASGSVNEQSLRPTDFVNRVLDGSSTKDVVAVVNMIKDQPELLEDLRQKTFEKVFREGARSATAEDVNRIMSGESTHLLSGVKIAERLKDREYSAKLKAILGDEGFDDLKQYVKLQVAPEARDSSFKAAGGLAAGAQIAQLERRGVLAYVEDSARHFVFSTLLSRGPLRKWLTSIPSEPGKIQLLLSNPIFLQAVTKEFGQGTAAEAFITRLKESVDSSMTAQPTAYQQQPTAFEQQREKWRSILNDTNAPAPVK